MMSEAICRRNLSACKLVLLSHVHIFYILPGMCFSWMSACRKTRLRSVWSSAQTRIWIRRKIFRTLRERRAQRSVSMTQMFLTMTLLRGVWMDPVQKKSFPGMYEGYVIRRLSLYFILIQDSSSLVINLFKLAKQILYFLNYKRFEGGGGISIHQCGILFLYTTEFS